MKKFWKKIPYFLKKILLLLVFSRILLIIIGLLTRNTLPLQDGQDLLFSTNPLIDMWSYWDSGFYIGIAQNWYQHISALDLTKEAILIKRDFAFLPLYPFLILVFSKLLILDAVSAAIVVSNICLYIAGIFIFKITSKLYDEKSAYLAVSLLFFFPTTFFYSSVLTESLFMMLLTLIFYFALKKQWLWAGFTGIFLSLTKLLGVFVIIPLLIEYYNHKKESGEPFDFKIIYLFLPIVGILTYLYLNYFYTQSYFTFSEIQSIYWGRETGIFLLHMIEGMTTKNPFLIFNYWYTIGILLVVLYGWFKLNIRFSLVALSLLLIFVPLSTSLWSMFRYTSVIFPVFIILGHILSQKSNLQSMYIYALIFILTGFLTVQWAVGSQFIM
jgi:Gpi18-like mannosyltransferase